MIAAALACGSVACATWGLSELVTGGRRARAGRAGRRTTGEKPWLAVALASRLRRPGSRAAPAGLQARLEAAGVGVGAPDFALLRAAAAVVGLLAVLPLAWAAPGRVEILVLAAAPAAGHLAPGAWLARRTRRRARRIEAELADVLDLLRVAVGAGLAPVRALGEVGRRHPGVLASELRRAAARRALGVPVRTVLHELQGRAPGEGLPALCAALRRADVHGAPLAPALAAQAEDARSRAAARTAEEAARAAPRIQLVVALGLVPAVLCLVAAALLPALGGWA